MEKNWQILAIFAVAFILRFLFISPWLEDWDSVQFTMALNNYSIALHLPHPPGYPIYILLGKVFNLFIPDGALALTMMSVVLGSLTVIPLYLLTKEMFNKKIAITSTLIFITAPIHWILSTVALTNVPGQFFLLLLIYLLYHFRNSYYALIFIAWLFGLMLGIRFTELPIIIALFALILIRKKSIRLSILSILAFLSGVLLWVIPLIYITGPDKFITSFTIIANYIFSHDSVGVDKFNVAFITERLSTYVYLMNASYTPLLLITFLSGTFILLFKFRQKVNFELLFLIVYFFSYAFTHLAFYNMEVTRYTLPLLPPLVILTAFFIFRISNKKLIYIFLVVLLAYIFSISFDQLTRFKNSTPATIAPILFVLENIDPTKTSIISSTVFRQFQFYAKDYKVYHVDNVSNDAFLNDIIIIDYLGTIDKYPVLREYEIIKKMHFEADKDIFPRVPQTDLYVLRKNEQEL